METKTTGRNDPCPCGSGKKYKACCLAKDEAAAREARAKEAETAAPAEAAEAAPADAHAAPPAEKRHQTRQPWKGAANTRGFTNAKVNAPRRSGSS